MEGVQVRKYESIESVAERLNVNPRTVRRAIARGDLTGYRVRGGRSLRVESREVDERLLKPIPTTVNAAS